ncbi:MAG: uracil-DNA glycosylase family protein [Betaproteobacteria bacterium]|nr:uracil-DNA glycosylase [Rubrivivax sp.]
MAWTERQHRLLAAMGLRLLSAQAAEGASPAQPAATEPAPARARAPVAPPAVTAVDAAVTAAVSAAVPTSALPAADRRVAPPPADAPGARPGSAAAAVSALGWPELREAVAACRACGLCERRTQTVFGVGSPQAQWMVVGEAPGEQEDREGEPFVGAAGQLLDRMLAALQLTRAQEPGTPPERQVYIANTLKCRPPGNRNPAPEELARCEPFLVRQIELLKPRIILAMGRFAVQALLRSDEPIGRLRGRVHRYQGVPLVVTYHPAYLLRNLPEKAKAWDDLCFAAEVFERPPAG